MEREGEVKKKRRGEIEIEREGDGNVWVEERGRAIFLYSVWCVKLLPFWKCESKFIAVVMINPDLVSSS